MANTFKEVQGSDVILMFNLGDGFLPFVCAKDFSIETTASRVPITTKGDGPWDKFDYQSLSYTINCSGVIAFDETAITSFDLALQQQNFLTPEWKAIFVTKDRTKAITYKGVCLVERTGISANAGQLSLSDFSLPGTGAYIMVDCDLVIAGMSVSGTPGPRTLTIGSLVGGATASSYIYTIDGGFELTAGASPWVLPQLPNGFHMLVVTPVCESGSRGEPFENEVLIEGEPLLPEDTCPVVTGVNITGVTSTSFFVNFFAAPSAISYTARVKNVATNAVIFFYGTSSPVACTGLLPATQYQVFIITVCDIGNTSGPSTVHTVQTDP